MAATKSDDDEKPTDKTQLGMARPPQLKRPPAAEERADADTKAAQASPDRTQGSAAAPPPLPTPSKSAAAPASDAESPAVADAGEDEGTVIIPRERAVRVRLQRLQPPGHSAMVALDRTSYVAGRSHTCDLPLYSPAASREHARLTFRDGAWYVQPVEGKTVLLDGATVRSEQRLTHKMRLQLGGDELLFLDEAEAAAVTPKPLAAAPAKERGSRLWLVIALVLLAAVVAAAWLALP